jgi:hypothetical protein
MRRTATAALAVVGLALVAEPALAIPAFARRYSVDCHFCHDIYPKLNAMGQRFKERGFRMDRGEDFDVEKWLASVPVSVRAQGRTTFFEGGDDFSYAYLKGISAGNLGARVSYWVDDGVIFSEGDDNFSHVKPDNAWARVEVVRGGRLYLKGGRFELDIPFTQTRTPHLLSYEIYFTNTGAESDSVARYQEGLEVGGDLGGDARWSAAVVQRVNRGSLVSRFGNLYLRATKRIERNRIGGFAFFGKSELPGRLVDNTFRIGADGDFRVDRLNVYGVYMYGRNDNSTGTGESLSFHGGFAQGDYRLRDELALTLRFNVVNRPLGSAGNSWESSMVPGAQVWLLGDRLRLSAEYAFRANGRSDVGAVQAEIAF